MKKVNKLFMLVLGFSAGILSGAFVRLGFEIIAGRPVSVGGEALIIPLIVLLVYFGFTLGRETARQRRSIHTYRQGYQEGYVKGVAQMTREVQHELYPEKPNSIGVPLVRPGP
ncbi:MAG: hypothetical protein VB094_05070 [Oscillibacter sp.]|nr:hypothetical protein [Oscillibacter sp.]